MLPKRALASRVSRVSRVPRAMLPSASPAAGCGTRRRRGSRVTTRQHEEANLGPSSGAPAESAAADMRRRTAAPDALLHSPHRRTSSASTSVQAHTDQRDREGKTHEYVIQYYYDMIRTDVKPLWPSIQRGVTVGRHATVLVPAPFHDPDSRECRVCPLRSAASLEVMK